MTPTPVLIVTDIGADIDDTLALLTLLGAAESIQIVGIVTCVGNGAKRATVASGWLNVVSSDICSKIPILPTVDEPIVTAGIHIPEEFDGAGFVSIGKAEDTPAKIVQLAAAHAPNLVLFCIAPVTPIAAALAVDKQGVLKKLKRVYVQGNVQVDDELGQLAPRDIAYNFRLDMEAAGKVFELQQHVPFSVLGKFAAYRVSLTSKDFSEFEHDGIPSLLKAALAQLSAFKQNNPGAFQRVYGVNSEDMLVDSWVEKLEAISHPYDPLLALLLIQDVSQEKGNYKLFQEITVLDRHVLVGNSKADHGIPLPEEVKQVLKRAIKRAISKSG